MQDPDDKTQDVSTVDGDLEGADYGNELPSDSAAPEPAEAAPAEPAEAAPTEPATDEAVPTEEGDPEGAAAEDEGEEAGEAAESAEAGDESAGDSQRDGYWIPKSRYDHVSQQLREAREQLANTKPKAAQQPEPEPESEAPAYDFDDAEQRYMDAVLDGNADDAKNIRQEIRAAERDQFMREAQQNSQESASQVEARVQAQEVAKRVYDQYPVFDPASESYNDDLTHETNEIRDGFLAQGYGVAESIQKAVDIMARANGLNGEPPPVPTETAPAAKPTGQRKGDLARKVEASRQQPPQTKGSVSKEGDFQNVDISNMSEEEFEALPESTLSRLCGDQA